ncbi:MAG: hypothetical protein I4N51_14115 [Acinetobacter sp.]|nr:hypothetical protein [Acinetobacter sp.]
MNNRPLTYVSEEQDLSILAPSSFLQEIRIRDVPGLDQFEKVNVVKRFRYIQRVRKYLKQRFRREYLGFLRSSIHKKYNRIQIGDIVLTDSEDKKRLHWPLAKVIELFPSKDEIIWLVKLRTSKEILL